MVVSSELHRKVKGVEGSSGSSTSGSSNAQGLTDIHPGGSGATASPQWLPRLSTAGTSSGAPTAPAVATAPAATSAPPPPWATAPPQPCPLSGMQLYCLSKLYNLWFVSGLAARLPPHVTANAVTPGWVPGTSLGRDAPWLARLVYQVGVRGGGRAGGAALWVGAGIRFERCEGRHDALCSVAWSPLTVGRRTAKRRRAECATGRADKLGAEYLRTTWGRVQHIRGIAYTRYSLGAYSLGARWRW